MKCVLCAKKMDQVTTSFNSRWGDCKVTIDGLKAYQCEYCQRIVFEPEVARMIQNITARLSEIPSLERPDMVSINDIVG